MHITITGGEMKKIVISLLVLSLIGSCSKSQDLTEGGKYPKPDKLCALTFDDGPSADPELTAKVLDNLKKHRVPATFFLVGQNFSEQTRPVVDRIVNEGHEIGNHSWSYDGMAAMSAEEVKASIEKTNAVINEYAKRTPSFFRAPNLSASSTMYEVIDMPFASGVLGFDWPGGGSGTQEQVVAKVKEGMKDGAIILLHDVQPKPHPTPDAIDTLIVDLKKEGYEFVTLSDLFKRKGVKADSKAEMMYVYVE